jgi:integrase
MESASHRGYTQNGCWLASGWLSAVLEMALHESMDKIRDVLAAILRKAAFKKYSLIDKDPMEHIELPRATTGKKTRKPHITPEQFDALVNAIPELYATMFYVAVYSGLRVSELIGLKWNDIGTDSITVDQRYCRGDWSEPKSQASKQPSAWTDL